MIYMFLAEGFEEVEALAPADILRRCGVEVKLVGVGSKTVTGAHRISVNCDMTEDEIVLDSRIEGVFLPGGMPGTHNLAYSSKVNETIDFCYDNGLLLCAICAAPLILGNKGLLVGKQAICFPGFECELIGADISDKYICEDGNILTAKGMGSAVEFGYRIAARLVGEAKAKEVHDSLQIYND